MANGDDLGAVVFIDDRTAAGAASIARNLGNAAAGMSQLTRETVGLNRALQFIDTGTGSVVSTFQALNAVGVVTTGELKNQIAAYDQLIARTKDDAAATAQLIGQQRRLKDTLAGTTGRMRGTTGSALDAQQAFSGFGLVLRGLSTGSLSSATFGLTQLSNNIAVIGIRAKRSGGTIKSTLISALKGGGGLALALTAAGLAFEFFNRETKESEENIKGLASAIDALNLAPNEFIGGLIKVSSEIKKLQDQGLQLTEPKRLADLLELQERLTELTKEHTEEIKARSLAASLNINLLDDTTGATVRLTDAEKSRLRTLEKIAELGRAQFIGRTPVVPREGLAPLADLSINLPAIELRQVVDSGTEAVIRQASEWNVLGAGIVSTLDKGREFTDTLTSGISRMILGLGTANDLLEDMKFAFADLLTLGLQIGAGALVGSLFGNPLLGASIASGVDFGRQSQGATSGFNTAGPLRLTVVQRGPDMQFALDLSRRVEGL